MNNLKNITVHKTNQLAFLSLAAGILSVSPYLPAATAIILHDMLGSEALLQVATSIPVTVYAIAGLLFGTISLILGGRAIEEIKEGGSGEKGHGLAIVGRVFGVFGVFMNVLFGLLFVLLLRMSFD